MARKFKNPPRKFKPRKKFKKRKPAYKMNKFSGPKLQVSREVKHIATPVESVIVAAHVQDSANMENGKLMYPCGFNADQPHINQGTGCNALIGCFIRPLYCTQKFQVQFDALDYSHADTNKGLRLRCRSGWVRNTGAKSGSSTTGTAAAWQAHINYMVLTELQAADLDADYLTFRQRSRNVMIVKDSYIKPKLNQNMGAPDGLGTTDICAPEVNFTINWDKTKGFPRTKTRLVPTGSAPTSLVLHNHWIPFTYWSCDQLTANTGTIQVLSSSRYYFTDA